jgi:hypothetical protein
VEQDWKMEKLQPFLLGESASVRTIYSLNAYFMDDKANGWIIKKGKRAVINGGSLFIK